MDEEVIQQVVDLRIRQAVIITALLKLNDVVLITAQNVHNASNYDLVVKKVPEGLEVSVKSVV